MFLVIRKIIWRRAYGLPVVLMRINFCYCTLVEAPLMFCWRNASKMGAIASQRWAVVWICMRASLWTALV